MNITLRTPLARLALCLGLATPFAAWSVDAAAPTASKPTASVKKVDAKVPKAKGGNSAPGCDESNSPTKKLPSPPKCPPEMKVKAATQQQ